MDKLGIPDKLKDLQMGHADGSVQARYSHATDVMVQRLLDGLTEQWEAALQARREIARARPWPCWIACYGTESKSDHERSSPRILPSKGRRTEKTGPLYRETCL